MNRRSAVREKAALGATGVREYCRDDRLGVYKSVVICSACLPMVESLRRHGSFRAAVFPDLIVNAHHVGVTVRMLASL